MWLDSWTLATANEAVKAGKSGFTGGLVYDPKTGGGKGSYTHAILAIELQGLGKWDWGAFTWRNVIVQAKTKETEVSQRSVSIFGPTSPCLYSNAFLNSSLSFPTRIATNISTF